MKNRLTLALLSSTLLLTACGDNIDIVKGGTLNNYGALTVGQALDNYKACVPKTQKWENLKTENGMEIVQFTCQSSNFMEMSSRLMRKYANDESPTGLEKLDNVDIADAIFQFQFSIMKNKEEFKLEYSGITLVWPDGKKFSTSDDELYDRFYNNIDDFEEIFKLPEHMHILAFRQMDQQYELVFTLGRAQSK